MTMTKTRSFKEYFEDVVDRNHPLNNSNGWKSLNCPMCNDRRRRLGVLYTDTGGIRVSCFNGGCELQISPTGWEPDSPVGNRIRKLYEMLGGSWSSIPIADRGAFARKTGRSSIRSKLMNVEPTPQWNFRKQSLPKDTLIVSKENAEKYQGVKDALDYLKSRSEAFMELNVKFGWSPEFPDYVILPYYGDNGTIHGYVGRNIRGDKDNRFIQRKPQNFIYGQHLARKKSGYLFIMESAFDASLVSGCATLSAKMNPTQVATIKSLKHRIPILIPDQTKDMEYKSFVSVAKDNDWLISAPKWGYKDFGEAVKEMGLIRATKTIIDSANKKYLKVALQLDKG